VAASAAMAAVRAMMPATAAAVTLFFLVVGHGKHSAARRVCRRRGVYAALSFSRPPTGMNAAILSSVMRGLSPA
jgi:hypothetical protein